MTADLSGRIALVAGTGGGLVEAASAALTSAGADVTVAGHDEAPAEAVQRVIATGGRIDVLVNVADDLPTGSFQDTSPDDLTARVESILTGTFERCQHAGGQMLSQSGGTIVNLMSGSPAGGGGSTVAATLRGGLVGMTKVLGTEWVRRGVRVVALSVGPDPRTGDPVGADKVGNVVTYLCSDGASFITGSHVRAGEDFGP